MERSRHALGEKGGAVENSGRNQIGSSEWSHTESRSSISGQSGRIKYPSEPHAACCLLVDISGSMNDGGKIDELNQALARFKEEVCKDELNAQRVDVCVISFNEEARVETPFCPIEDFNPTELKANGDRCMGNAIELALRIVEQRMHDYHQLGIECYAPFVLMLTDGEPTDRDIYDYEKVRRRIKMEKKGRYGHLKFHVFGVERADPPFLKILIMHVDFVQNDGFRGVWWVRVFLGNIEIKWLSDPEPDPEPDRVVYEVPWND